MNVVQVPIKYWVPSAFAINQNMAVHLAEVSKGGPYDSLSFRLIPQMSHSLLGSSAENNLQRFGILWIFATL